MANHSSILTWRIPWTEERGGPQSMGLQELDTTEQLNHQPPPYIIEDLPFQPFSFLLLFCHIMWHVGLNSGPLQWECRVLTTGCQGSVILAIFKCTIKCTIQVYNSVAFSTFTILCHHHYLFPELFHYPKHKFCTR
ncbi:unnamed protein product [Rangifer tarandus platyrhynchus]|uniref:Uncharacterized protein n=2 Tax=Rangifer tarandus platyrhynchus TaxID=3082113 RepID=A0ABN8XW80_RANTA|nr:unnamed protein product [Rangifer tarandus platyrhynchus]